MSEKVTEGQTSYPQDMLTSHGIGNGERLACLGGMILHANLPCYCNGERLACLGGMILHANVPCYW